MNGLTIACPYCAETLLLEADAITDLSVEMGADKATAVNVSFLSVHRHP